MSSSASIKASIDTHITNKTLPGTIDNTLVGADIKSVVDYVDQKTTTGQRELRGTLLQSGTGIPIITVHKSNFSGTITAARLGVGIYTIDLSALTSTDYLTKSFCIIGNTNNPATAKATIIVGTDGGSDYFFTVQTYSVPGNILEDGHLNKTSFQIIVID